MLRIFLIFLLVLCFGLLAAIELNVPSDEFKMAAIWFARMAIFYNNVVMIAGSLKQLDINQILLGHYLINTKFAKNYLTFRLEMSH